jgi:predicted ATPase
MIDDMLSKDTIRNIRVQGLRCLEDVRVDLGGLTVLIGENGTGKSTIIEACEILRKASQPNLIGALNIAHGGLLLLLGQGTSRLRLGVTIEGPDDQLEYDFTLAQDGPHSIVDEERLLFKKQGDPEHRKIIDRNRSQATVFDPDGKKSGPGGVSPDTLTVSSYGVANGPPSLQRVHSALGRMRIHLPFHVLSYWGQREMKGIVSMREPTLANVAEKLERFGGNLVNTYQHLRNSRDWDETMEYIRLGLGDDVEDVLTPAAPGGGSIALAIRYRGFPEPVSSFTLSDGTLAYLAFVALFRLDRDRSLLAFDEPDLHLHPELLMRVLGMFATAGEDCPVLLSTHSDRLLDGLPDPASSAVLCKLDEKRSTRLVRPDRNALERWMENYRGIGEIRSEGHQASVFRKRD